MSPNGRRYRVVIADDSSLYRHILKKVLGNHPGLEVVEAATDGQQAVEAVRRLRPDGVVLDINMPRVNGFAALEQITKISNAPVIMVSADAMDDRQLAMRAAMLGAVDVFNKPSAAATTSVSEALTPLAEVVFAACDRRKDPSPPSRPSRSSTHDRAVAIIAIGASTGGIGAIGRVLGRLTPDAPPVLLAQHMPTGYTGALARQLDLETPLNVIESTPGHRPRPGELIICAANDRHTVVGRGPNGPVIEHQDGPKEHHQRPAVDPLFRSVARTFGDLALGVLLTGMGRDGAAGLDALRRAGATTIAEAESSAVVFGMPRAAIELGAAQHVMHLEDIAVALSNQRTLRSTEAAMPAHQPRSSLK